MRYIANLIPKKNKILENYFKGDSYSKKEKTFFDITVNWILAGFFMLIAILCLYHPLCFLLFGLLGFIVSPIGESYIEDKLNFRFEKKIKIISSFCIFLISIFVLGYYISNDSKQNRINEIRLRNLQKTAKLKQKNEEIRKDSIEFYLNKSIIFLKDENIDSSLLMIDKSLRISDTEEEKRKIENQKLIIDLFIIDDLISKSKYSNAIDKLDTVIYSFPTDSDLFLKRAICYSKSGEIKLAVDDSRKSIELGNNDAKLFYDKINPLKKRVAYYITRCCDGTTSNATGRGACSHHDGVCDWNEPVYEEYRKY